MKNIFKSMLLFLVIAMTACSADEFTGGNENGLPSMDGIDFTMSVDQTTNTMTASVEEHDGMYPVWVINGATYSTQNTVTWTNKIRGTYNVELRMANKNGFSQASVTKSFTFDNTKVDFTSYFNRLNDKTWRIDHGVDGHLGCGPSGTTGTAWWSAKADEKSSNGIYDDRMTFKSTSTTGGTYTYNSGADGKTFVNNGTTLWGTQDADWDATITNEQTADFTLESGTWTDANGNTEDCVYLVLSANTAFPYICSDAQYKSPRFRIEGLTATTLSLVYDDTTIAWHFTLTSEADETVTWCDVNSDLNLGRNINTLGTMTFWWADDSWAQQPSPSYTYENGVYTVSYSGKPGGSEWAAQTSIDGTSSGSEINLEAGEVYDISFKLNSNVAISRFTLKICQHGNDDNALYYANDLTADAGDNTIQITNVTNKQAITNAKFMLDFGGIAADPVLKISDIIIQKHNVK